MVLLLLLLLTWSKKKISNQLGFVFPFPCTVSRLFGNLSLDPDGFFSFICQRRHICTFSTLAVKWKTNTTITTVTITTRGGFYEWKVGSFSSSSIQNTKFIELFLNTSLFRRRYTRPTKFTPVDYLWGNKKQSSPPKGNYYKGARWGWVCQCMKKAYLALYWVKFTFGGVFAVAVFFPFLVDT